MYVPSLRYGREQGRSMGRGDRRQRGALGDRRGGAEKVCDEEKPERGRHPALLRGGDGEDADADEEEGRIALGVIVGRGGVGEPPARLPRGEAQPDEREGAEQAATEGEWIE